MISFISHSESAEAEETGQVKEDRCYLPEYCDLLKLILDEVRAVRGEEGRQYKENKKHGCYRRLAEITDYVFFVLYFSTCALFLAFMYLVWIAKVI